MHAFTVLAYIFDVGIHCPSCALKHYTQEELDNSETRDCEGNPISVLFVDNVEQEEVCDDCLEVIEGTEQPRPALALSADDDDYAWVPGDHLQEIKRLINVYNDGFMDLEIHKDKWRRDGYFLYERNTDIGISRKGWIGDVWVDILK